LQARSLAELNGDSLPEKPTRRVDGLILPNLTELANPNHAEGALVLTEVAVADDVARISNVWSIDAFHPYAALRDFATIARRYKRQFASREHEFGARDFDHFRSFVGDVDLERRSFIQQQSEVTIRSRGVMEKCTYCTQRISQGRIEAEKDGRKIRDGEVVTACQAACPADAITFGDMHDETSKIAKAKKDHRGYNLLNELNTQPRTTYLAGLKNQNKEMPDYQPPKETHSAAPETKPAGGDPH
jgi:hypothetical protein